MFEIDRIPLELGRVRPEHTCNFDTMESDASKCRDHTMPGDGDSLNWACAAEAMKCCHLDEVKSYMKTYYKSAQIVVEGKDLTVAHVAAIARRPEVLFKMNSKVAKSKVDECCDWLDRKIEEGRSIPGVTTGFGAASAQRTNQTRELQEELIRSVSTSSHPQQEAAGTILFSSLTELGG